MPCTTILAGKKATYDGSTFAARNEDSSAGKFTPKKLIVVRPEDQPKHYRSVLTHAEIELPEEPMRYTAMPNGTDEEGVWGAAGVNAANVAMTATETITSNERVLAADPLVLFRPAKGDGPEQSGGIGEEDFITLVLPYIRSAREGVLRLGGLLEQYGTWEMNGVAFQDADEIWWLETMGGHHWIARRVPDDAVAVISNQLGIDFFDLDDAFGTQKAHLCSADLREFIRENHLDLKPDRVLNARLAFGSHSDADRVYNTPRVWYAWRYLNPEEAARDRVSPESCELPWCAVPARKITPEDVKYILSSHYQGTPYDPYDAHNRAALDMKGAYRPIGVNRNNFLSLTQIRPYLPEAYRVLEWVAFGSNVFNAFVPLYANVDETPEYLSNTGKTVTTENFYWTNRLIGALADAAYHKCIAHVERYQQAVPAEGLGKILACDRLLADAAEGEGRALRARANTEITAMLREKTEKLLSDVLYEASMGMKNGYARSDG